MQSADILGAADDLNRFPGTDIHLADAGCRHWDAFRTPSPTPTPRPWPGRSDLRSPPPQIRPSKDDDQFVDGSSAEPVVSQGETRMKPAWTARDLRKCGLKSQVHRQVSSLSIASHCGATSFMAKNKGVRIVITLSAPNAGPIPPSVPACPVTTRKPPNTTERLEIKVHPHCNKMTPHKESSDLAVRFSSNRS